MWILLISVAAGRAEQPGQPDQPNRSALNGLTVRVFNNTAFAGQPRSTATVDTPVYSSNASHRTPFSASMTGTLAVERGYVYSFNCSFGDAVFGSAHIDGHLVCQTGVNRPHPPAGADVRSVAYDNPLPVLASMAWPLRLSILHNGSGHGPVTFGLNVSRTRGHTEGEPPPDLSDWLPAALTPSLPAAEEQRNALQGRLASGWGSWYDMSYTKMIRLPEGSALTLALCDNGKAAGSAANGTARCVTESRTDWVPKGNSDVRLRLGAHANDHSIAQLFFATAACNVSVSLGGGENLLVHVAVVQGCAGTDLVVIGGSAWYRAHAISVAANSLTFTPYGENVNETILVSTQPGSVSSLILPEEVVSQPHLVFPLGPGVSVGLSSQGLDASRIRERLDALMEMELGRYVKYGEHAEIKMAVQAGVVWNTIWNPLEGVIAPVIRGNPWGWDPATVNDDWPYILFDWDTHFAALMLSLDARELSYSTLIQVVKAKAANGFVPNGWASTRKSTHSQPPVGSRVLLDIYRRYGDEWLVQLLFDDLLDWSNWFNANRLLAPLNITALGGDDMQAARYESGLDNSPMYDGEFFAGEPYGLMQMYDVGMASMSAMSDEALATLAEVVNRTSDAAMLRARASVARSQIDEHLWDDTSGAYVNRFPNGEFNRRISPTSFYPMLAGAATPERAAAMVDGWLLNSSRFCIAASGDFAGNKESCYWGLPSISADDPAFPQLGYWRGFVWGPMALLTYWGLDHPNYADVHIVQTAKKALCKQMGALFLSQWRQHHHVCENFSPKKDAVDCTGMHFYHWGGLAGFIGLLDAGF